MNFAFKHQVMGIVIFLLSVSLLVALFFLGAYVWGVKSGQFDDDYSPAHRIFFDDNTASKSKTNNK